MSLRKELIEGFSFYKTCAELYLIILAPQVMIWNSLVTL